MLSTSHSVSLSIELLPEFGWSINNKPAYGPGSVFQGFVKLNAKPPELNIERVRLAFSAFETILPYDISPGVVRNSRNPLFTIQHVLWEPKDQSLVSDKGPDYSFPFTIQMPLIQFPPSMAHSKYQCEYQLIALLDASPSSSKKSSQTVKAVRSVLYMPFIEANLLKTPSMLEAQKGCLTIKARMSAFEFVPNDDLCLYLRIDNSKIDTRRKTRGAGSLPCVSVTLKLIQVLEVVVFDDMDDQTQVIASIAHKLLLINNPDRQGSHCEAHLSLPLPADLTPSYDYGRLVRVVYKLQINVELRGPLGGIWCYNVRLSDIPITIGTLGYGIKNSSDLETYTQFQQDPHNKSIPIPLLPKFMKAIEYEDALPMYDPSKLPQYESFISQISTSG
ncbi:MAG: hypothetical protein EXX96DRAFT_494107 [Benjaminiella poitrasii]|nr:MAG: hypothetical protein EXX96DRAFT_494107 [Benjaminiella poitrasii]